MQKIETRAEAKLKLEVYFSKKIKRKKKKKKKKKKKLACKEGWNCISVGKHCFTTFEENIYSYARI